LIGCC